MRNRTMLSAIAVLALLGVMPLLAACHTAAGAGEDLSKTGQAIEKAVDKNTP